MSGIKPLYRLMPLCVLLALSCGGEERENSQRSPSEPRPVVTPEAEGSEASRPRILVLGNSITAGYGLTPEQAFPARLQARVDSAGFGYQVVNAGLSGETTAGGRRRIEWLLRQDADILIIELGGNDGLRGTEPESMRENLLAIIESARSTNPDMKIILGGMRMPMNMGGPYRDQFESVYPEIAEETGVVLIPHILEGVGGVPSMNQPDGIHPTAAGQEVIAETVWEMLEPLLAKST
jgi:acyl-CoA thioesterase-1